MTQDQIAERSALVCALTGGHVWGVKYYPTSNREGAYAVWNCRVCGVYGGGGDDPEPSEDGTAAESPSRSGDAFRHAVPRGEHVALAAQAIATDENVRRVVVFGSVAAHRSTARSDIDLMVVCEDIDYLGRHQEANRMSAIGTEAAGWPVGVLFTDIPELEWRVQHVRSSFENKVLAGSATIVDRPIRPERVRAGKQIGAETSDAGEAASRLGDTCEPLEAMTAAMSAAVCIFGARVTAERLNRRYAITVIRNAAMVLESAIKSLHHSQHGTWPDKTSDPWELAEAVPDGIPKQGVTATLGRLAKTEQADPSADELTHADWRWPGPRMMDVPHSWWHTTDRALRWATTAAIVTRIALNAVDEHLPERPEVIDTDQCLAEMQHATIAWTRFTTTSTSEP